MGRTAITVRKTDFDACFPDRSAEECFPFDLGPKGAAPVSSSAYESISPETAQRSPPVDKIQASVPESEVGPQQIWFQLAGPERQRFGHCFSLMVLKALGLRQISFTEEQA